MPRPAAIRQPLFRRPHREDCTEADGCETRRHLNTRLTGPLPTLTLVTVVTDNACTRLCRLLGIHVRPLLMTDPTNRELDSTQTPPTASEPAAQTSPRAIRPAMLAGLLLMAAAVIGLVALAVVLFGNRMPELTEDDLQAAVARWNEDGPKSYDLELELEGARPGTVQVEVRGGVVVAMQRDKQTPRRRATWDVWSVPGQFDTMLRELEMAENPNREMGAPQGTRWLLRAEFDPEFGFPRGFQRVVLGGGPEVSWRVTRFEAK